MTSSTAVPRLARWTHALSFGAIAVASLAFTGTANAAVIPVSPDGTSGTDNISTAITQANTNADTSNTLVLAPGTYTPKSTSTEPTITKNLVITGSHANQGAATAPAIDVDGSQQATGSPGNLFSIAAGVNVTFEAFQIINGGGSGFNQIDDAGNLTMWGMALSGAPGGAITVEPAASLAFNESTVSGMAQTGIFNNGTLSADTADVVAGSSTGIANNGTDTLHNTLIAKNGTGSNNNCTGAAPTNGGPGSMDDSPVGAATTCHVAFPNTTSVTGCFPLTARGNGGPNLTFLLKASGTTGCATNPTINAGTSCLTTDARFFANPGGGTSCDIGAVSRGATRDTTPPSCTVTFTDTSGNAGATQQVTVQDAASGIGTEPGSANDPLTTATNPRAAASPAVPDDGISGLGIQNGTVAFNPFTAPSTGPLVLTATKTAAGAGSTHWWFTATDWAGNVTFCS